MGDDFSVADAYLFTVANWTAHVGIDISGAEEPERLHGPHGRPAGGAGGDEGRRPAEVGRADARAPSSLLRWPRSRSRPRPRDAAPPGRYEATLCVAASRLGAALPAARPSSSVRSSWRASRCRSADIVYRLHLRPEQVDVATMQGTMQIDEFSADVRLVATGR